MQFKILRYAQDDNGYNAIPFDVILSEAKNLFVDKSILSLIIFLGNINISRQGEIPDRRKSFYSIARNPCKRWIR